MLGLGLIDTQSGPEPEEARPVYDAMTGEWLANCAACCVPEIAGACTRAGIPYDTVAGTWTTAGTWSDGSATGRDGFVEPAEVAQADRLDVGRDDALGLLGGCG